MYKGVVVLTSHSVKHFHNRGAVNKAKKLAGLIGGPPTITFG